MPLEAPPPVLEPQHLEVVKPADLHASDLQPHPLLNLQVQQPPSITQDHPHLVRSTYLLPVGLDFQCK